MKFRTELHIDTLKPEKKLNHKKTILMMGSCFSDNIGEILQKYLFHISVNPFGVTYNPQSILKCLNALQNKTIYAEKDLEYYNELWFSYDHYTLFSDVSKQNALNKINIDFRIAKQMLDKLDFLILTFGTAWVYSRKKDGMIVNNCHKIPARDFERKSLNVADIVDSYSQLIDTLKEKNRNLQLILTVSPVRHIKDGLIGNQQSKATLILACRELAKTFPENCSYFPSYEIMMDDLRDYRYYDEDLIHPNKQAINYIWDKFATYAINNESLEICSKLDPVLKALSHKPMHRDTEQYQKFKENTNKKLLDLQRKYPFVDWDRIW